MMDVFDRMKNV